MNLIVTKSSNGLDRISTWDEVQYAVSAPSRSAFESVRIRHDLIEVGRDVGGYICNLSEDSMWLAIIDKMPESKCN
jgi:hypothetical protein